MNRLTRIAVVTATLTAAMATGAPTAFANVVLNGGFESGPTGFGSAYLYQDPSHVDPDAPSVPSALYSPGTYSIGTDPSLFHWLWASYGDQDTGSGNMMIVNGASDPDVAVWTSTVAVDLDTDYYFWTWVAASFDRSPTVLAFDINGTQIGSDFTVAIPSTDPAYPPLGTWQLFYTHWNSGANATANLSIVNRNTAYAGNDFALDGIGLDRARPSGGTDTTIDDRKTSVDQTIPEPGTLALLVSGLLGPVVMRRRRVS